MGFEYPLNPGPSSNIPRISAPGCLGMLPQFETEWWYYAGVAFSKNERFSVQLEVIRSGLLGAVGIAAIARHSDRQYFWSIGYGLGISQDADFPLALTVPPVTDDAYAVTFTSLEPAKQFDVTYTRGKNRVGTAGATYRLTSSGVDDARGAFSAELDLLNGRGLVLEGESGFVGPGMAGGGSASLGNNAATYEFAEPVLTIAGGTITLDGKPYALTGGDLWLDRQVLSNPVSSGAPAATVDPEHPEQALLPSAVGLYLGDWMAIKLDNGPTVVLATFWQPAKPGEPQWITGTGVGRKPLAGFGTIYFPPGAESSNGGIGILGVRVDADTHDFDINLANTTIPEKSPHWTSPASGHTYPTAWHVSFDPRLRQYGVPANLHLRAVVEGCENALPGSSFWEGGADVYGDSALNHRIGTAFVEQIGMN